MYEPRPSTRDRAATIAMVLLIHAALAFALINASGSVRERLPEEIVELIDVAVPPPPEEEVVVEQIPAAEQDAPREEEGAASAENIRSRATPPRPPIPLPVPQPMPVTQTPNTGSDPTQGASDRPGPGTGAGGVGVGTGSGGAGSGTGGGGLGGIASVRTRLATPPLSGRDFPNEMLDSWPRGAGIFARFRVDANGMIIQCIVDRGTGDERIDSNFCQIAKARLRFRPGLDQAGRRVADWAAYGQRAPR